MKIINHLSSITWFTNCCICQYNDYTTLWYKLIAFNTLSM